MSHEYTIMNKKPITPSSGFITDIKTKQNPL